MFDLIIKKGMAVLPDAVEMVDIAVKNGVIAAMAPWLMCTCIFLNPAALNGKAIVVVHRQWLPAELLHLQKCR